MYQRKLDVGLLVLIARQMGPERRETGVISVDPMDGKPTVHVANEVLSEVSIPDVWTWTRRNVRGGAPWRASTTIAGVEFFALFTDEERQAVIDGE